MTSASLPFRTLLFVSLAAASACASPPADEEEAGSTEGASTAAPEKKSDHARCDGGFRTYVLQDARQRSQSFDITVEPYAAAELYLGSNWETFTATVTSPKGTTRRAVSTKEHSKHPLLVNTWREAKTYHVTIERSTEAHYNFVVNCMALVDAPRKSGMDDHAACKADQPCVKSTPEGDRSGVCDGGIHPNLGDDWNAGFCY